jgi:HNH endonuclease
MNLEERFEEKYISEPNTGCWLWTACLDDKGYGGIMYQKIYRKAHRVSAFLYGILNDLKSPLHVCHKCDTPQCVNPNHLFVGTNRDNAQDRARKGRNASKKGELNGQCILSLGDVVWIKQNLHLSNSKLGAKFGVHRKTIYSIRTGKNWKHV